MKKKEWASFEIVSCSKMSQLGRCRKELVVFVRYE